MKFTFYGHACFSLKMNGKHVLFDPFISGNELAAYIQKDSIPADFILISHGHADHIADAVDIAKRTGAMVICNWEIAGWLQNQGLTNVHPMNTGGSREFDFGKVKCTVAQHSSGLPDGSYGGNPMGFLLFAEGKQVYYSGDTSLTLDMQLIPKWAPQLDAAILPIGDNFTMDVADAIDAASMVGAQKVVGVHYNTFGYIVIDTEKAKNDFKTAGKELLLPAIGETIDI
jgi:L-ascorbate metabolism protein UlaG (beta-lactamase superfamily)